MLQTWNYCSPRGGAMGLSTFLTNKIFRIMLQVINFLLLYCECNILLYFQSTVDWYCPGYVPFNFVYSSLARARDVTQLFIPGPQPTEGLHIVVSRIHLILAVSPTVSN